MNRRGILVVVSGFSGVGKGTLMKQLTERYGYYALSISATTRAPREGEEDGREYFFKTREEFEELIREDRLVEYACYCGNYYGTPRDYVEDQMDQGRDVILEIELQGALKIKEKYPEALLLFVMLARAVEEAAGAVQYDYMIINDDLEQSVEEVHYLIDSQHNKISRNLDFVEQVREELITFSKGEL